MMWGNQNYSLYQHQPPHQPFRLPLFATYRPRLPLEHVLAGRGGLSALMGWTWRASYSHHRLTKRWCLLIAQTRGMEGSCSTGSPQHLFPRQPPSQPHWPCPVSSVLTVVPYYAVRTDEGERLLFEENNITLGTSFIKFNQFTFTDDFNTLVVSNYLFVF